jgi:glutathione S-transferase
MRRAAWCSSGAIVLHIGEKSETLLPADPKARKRAICWLFAALNTIEPPVQQLAEIDLFHADKAWTKERRPEMEAWVRKRLAELAASLGDKDYLEGEFTLGDLMMATVLRNLRINDLIDAEPKLRAYLERCEARPAFQRAIRDHMASFEDQAA